MKFKNVKKTLYLRGAGTVLTLSLAAGTIAPAAPAFAEAQDSTVSEKEVSETDAARDDVSLGTEAEFLRRRFLLISGHSIRKGRTDWRRW